MTIDSLIEELADARRAYGNLTVKHVRAIKEDGPEYGHVEDGDITVSVREIGTHVPVLAIRSEL